jgi:hypothetical protein
VWQKDLEIGESQGEQMLFCGLDVFANRWLSAGTVERFSH